MQLFPCVFFWEFASFKSCVAIIGLFEIGFCVWYKIRVQSCSFACGCCDFPSTICQRGCPFHCMAQHPYQNRVIIHRAFICELSSLILWSLLSLYTLYHLFVTRSLVLCFEIRKCESFQPGFFKLTLAIWTPLSFSMNVVLDFSCIHFLFEIKGTDIKALPPPG